MQVGQFAQNLQAQLTGKRALYIYYTKTKDLHMAHLLTISATYYLHMM